MWQNTLLEGFEIWLILTLSGLETAAASVALFPGSGTIAAATVGALGSVAAVAAGGVALLGGGVAAAAFKFSPSLNGETGAMTKQEREQRLEEIKKVKPWNWI